MARDFKVAITPGTSRAEDFLKVFGRLDVHVVSPIPHWGLIPGYVEAQLVYMLDLKALSHKEFWRLVEHLAGRFSISSDEVIGDLNIVGVPILADECDVIITNPQRWL